MTPDDLVMVRRSWAVLRQRRVAFLDRLSSALVPVSAAPSCAIAQAHLLIDVADELVDVLATPSQLRARASALAGAPAPGAVLPRSGVDGVAWRRAAADICATWSTADDEAWAGAWVLLANVLAEDWLAPFDDPLEVRAVPHGPPT